MLKIDYSFTTKSRLHHGGDKQTGNIKMFRREEIYLHPDLRVDLKSKFKSEESRRRAVIAVLKAVYRSISPEWKERNYKVLWDQFSARCYTAAVQANDQFSFLNTICQMFNITNLQQPETIEFLQNFTGQEFNQVLLDELQYLIAFLRLDLQREKDEQDIPLFVDDQDQEKPDLVFKREFVQVPFIAGNHIGGLLRRLLVYDFCERVGISRDLFEEKEDDVIMPREIYHQLMTGGNITENTGFEDIEKRETFLRMCPPIGLLGSAIGNMTIRGKIAIGDAQLRCKEMCTGDVPFHKFLFVDFGTRMDSEKQETEINISRDALVGKTTPQMIYYNEVITKGAVFDHWYKLSTASPVLISCFWRGIELFKQTPFLGGKRKVGLGKVDFQVEIPAEASLEYQNYLEKNKAAMRDYFSVVQN